ncbi:MAG: type I DNA topoisomerase [Saprospiraceae bacterium]|nr:type I DNA topoisomerase [Saprospiraceae bacterium]
MSKNLLIVESPAKAKTIEKILGKDFTVKSSFGHVRDLEKGNNAVDVAHDFKPKYIVSPEKKKVVSELKGWVKKVDEVWLATDEDREGEAISWHLCEVLGLDASSTKRIVFREITKPAVQKAVQNPRLVDINLVNAQQARRILDRLVGFELSGILWKKVKGKLSAGRVQSVAVKLLVERERQINAFKATPFFKLVALFDVKNETGRIVKLKAESPTRFDSEKDAEAFLKACINAQFQINSIEVKPLKRRPTAPFTTSTLQQEASRKLGFAVKRTMSVAQRLYEAGCITYMRTDSTALSEVALASIAQEIEKNYGKDYLQTRRFKSKNSNAQEAHEAIRPTYINRHEVSTNRDEQRLYELIWKRTIASQMAEAILEKTTVKIGVSTVPDATLNAVGEVLKFDGFLKVYLESKDDDEEEETKGMLPPLKRGQILQLNNMSATERFTRPPARFTEAALVKKLEELGIGRPSTYAPTISKIMEEGRGYVTKESREGVERKYTVLNLASGQISKKQDSEVTGTVKNRLFPSDLGITVSDFLDEHFDKIMDYNFTAGIEKKFDRIATGGQEWTKMLNEFYGPFHATVEDTLENAERATGERILGKDPETGRTLLTRITRNGPVAQIGTQEELEEGEKPKYANLRPGQSIETITAEEALKLFELPRVLGNYMNEEISVGAGRYGPYIKYGEKKFVSIPRTEDPLKISMERAKELINEKEKAEAPVGTYKGLPIQKGKGRFGPFLKWNNLFVNIPRRFDPETIELEQMHELIEAKVQKEANRYIHQWPDEKITVENGRWGPYIKFKKKNVKIPKKNDGTRVTSEEAKDYTLEDVKKLIELEIPDAFAKKKKAAAKKKTTTKKTKK